MIITLDGPSGSGKSTLAQLLAQELGYFYLNTGFLYRALGYILVTHYGYDGEKLRNPDLKDIESCLLSGKLIYEYIDNHAIVSFKGDITGKLKLVEVSDYASLISRHSEVRSILMKYQRNLALEKRDVVVEGRDCGSTVFFDAPLKFFVTASSEVRAKRLQKDQKKLGRKLSYQEAYDFVIKRDNRDKNREHAPLVQPEGSVFIDTSELSAQEALKEMMRFV